MKKLMYLVIAVTVMVLAMGCGSAPAASSGTPAAAPAASSSAASSAGSGLPVWFSEAPSEDAVFGIGIAKLTNPSLALETATTRAQRDIARQVNAVVQGMLVDYANESGLASNPRSMISIENIGRNLINMNLSGSTVDKRDQGADGTWYVRVYARKADIARQAAAIVDTEMADYAEYRRERATDMLNSAINSTLFRTQGLAE
jgi:hypothetical protein